MSIWITLLMAKSPEDLSPEDWKRLRSVAADIQGFSTEKRESTSSKARRLLNILGFASFEDMKKQHRSSYADVHLVIELSKATLETGLSILKYSENNGITNYDGVYLEGQHLRNEYYEAMKRLNMTSDTVESLFADWMGGTTPEQYKKSLAARRKVRITSANN